MIQSYQAGDTVYTVNLEARSDGRYTATIADRTYVIDATQLNQGGWLLAVDGAARVTAYTAAHGGERYVRVGRGSVKRLSVVDSRRPRRRSAAASGESHLTAQMPGQVVEVFVQPGETVTAGQLVMILEAMKMEIRVTASNDGVVSDIFVKQGDVVERDQRLIDIEHKSQ